MQNPITVEKKGEGEKPILPDHLVSKTRVKHGALSMLQMMMLQKQHRNCPNRLKYVLNLVPTFNCVGLHETCASSQRETDDSSKQPLREKCAIIDKMCCQIA